MSETSIFTQFLSALEVPHTKNYSEERFRTMSFKSLFGLSHLLQDYGIKNYALRISDKSEITKITPPFIVQSNDGLFVIIREIDPQSGKIIYDRKNQIIESDLNSFKDKWNGIALLAFPDEKSCEPEYKSHHLTEIIKTLSRYALVAAAIAVFVYFFITRHIYANISTILLTALNLAGLYFSFMLLQKSLNIHTATSEKVCGMIEKGGCDTIMSMKVSKLFGVFSWSEVGFGYFGISLIVLLLFPHIWSGLALCNICCLPYTFWSVWYQKFRAKHWCTLCLGVQSTLWLLFFCYLGGGMVKNIMPLRFDYLILIAVYIFSVLFLNMILGVFKNLPCHEKNT